MEIAFIALPKENTPVEGICNNFNGYWNPPDFVISFWYSACKVEYFGTEDYEKKKIIVYESFMKMITQFYQENVL
jgi:hypothetical protein